MRLTKAILHLTGIVCSMMAVGCVNTSTLQDELHVPLVNIQDGQRQRYMQDVQQCREQALKLYEGKADKRNQNRDLRACLISKGYVLMG